MMREREKEKEKCWAENINNRSRAKLYRWHRHVVIIGPLFFFSFWSSALADLFFSFSSLVGCAFITSCCYSSNSFFLYVCVGIETNGRRRRSAYYSGSFSFLFRHVQVAYYWNLNPSPTLHPSSFLYNIVVVIIYWCLPFLLVGLDHLTFEFQFWDRFPSQDDFPVDHNSLTCHDFVDKSRSSCGCDKMAQWTSFVNRFFFSVSYSKS